MENENENTRPTVKETGPVLFLSLFLLLLAFFILLNALSTYQETKSRAVITSLAATFEARRTPDMSTEIVVSTLGETPEPEQVLTEVERLWRMAIPIAEVEMLPSGDTVLVELPITQVFVGAEARLRGDRQDLIDATAYALSARLEGKIVEMQALVRVEEMKGVETAREIDAADAVAANDQATDQTVDVDDPSAEFLPTGLLDGFELGFARSVNFSRQLVEGGTPPDNLQVGLVQGNPNRLQLRFFIRDSDDARLTFASLGEEGSQ